MLSFPLFGLLQLSIDVECAMVVYFSLDAARFCLQESFSKSEGGDGRPAARIINYYNLWIIAMNNYCIQKNLINLNLLFII